MKFIPRANAAKQGRKERNDKGRPRGAYRPRKPQHHPIVIVVRPGSS